MAVNTGSANPRGHVQISSLSEKLSVSLNISERARWVACPLCVRARWVACLLGRIRAGTLGDIQANT